MRILALTKDWYGQRIFGNVKTRAPEGWLVEEVDFSGVRLPPLVDEPKDFLPENLPETDLILFLAQDAGLIQLLGAAAQKTGAKSALVAVDKTGWLPQGLQHQIDEELARLGVYCAFARPLCSLTPPGDPLVDEFAKNFGLPQVEADVGDGKVKKVSVLCGAPCGSTHYIAEKLAGISTEDAAEKAGLLLHNFPCMASMTYDNTVKETLMHIAGYKIKNAVKKAVKEKQGS